MSSVQTALPSEQPHAVDPQTYQASTAGELTYGEDKAICGRVNTAQQTASSVTLHQLRPWCAVQYLLGTMVYASIASLADQS